MLPVKILAYPAEVIYLENYIQWDNGVALGRAGNWLISALFSGRINLSDQS